MAVSVSRDLSVTVGEDIVVEKQTLLKNLENSECKSLGISQLMLGLLVMLNTIPLLFSEFAEVMTCGLPLWSGLVFVIAGVLATMVEKHTNRNYLYSCMAMSAVAVLTSAAGLIILFTDIIRHPAARCEDSMRCTSKHYITSFSIGVKTSLALYTLIHAIVSIILIHTLYSAKKHLQLYGRING